MIGVYVYLNRVAEGTLGRVCGVLIELLKSDLKYYIRGSESLLQIACEEEKK